MIQLPLLTHAPIALAPVLIFLAMLVRGDSYKLLRLRTVLLLVATGIVAAGVSYLLSSQAYAHYPGDFQSFSHLVSPWIEESLKAAVLIFLIRTRRVGFPVDAGIAGFAIGTGFALVENLYYLASRPEISLPVQVIRGFGTAIMHGGTTTILAMIAMTLYERRPNGGWPLLLPGFLAAVALHTGFNIMLVRPAFATLVTLVVLQLVIYLVFQHSERTLRSWLDTDSDSKVQLLETINSGTFLDSNAGQYLRSLSDRLEGGALVDMLCLLRLHGELALRAKGVLLLRESGMEVPPLDEPTRDKLAELAELQRSIGKTGMLMLRPLMMASGKDMWQLTLLGE
jgi:RsiW-degrading membrane proteinase PrsW (M82 family)